jgi:hypothetical protein
MSKSLNTPASKVVPGQPGRVVESEPPSIEAGTWLFLQEAVDATGLHEKTLRRRVQKGVLKMRRVGKQQNSPVQYWITASIRADDTTDGQIIDAESDAADVECVDSTVSDDADQSSNIEGTSPAAGPTRAAESTPIGDSPNLDSAGVQLDQILQKLTHHFAEKLGEQNNVIHSLQNELNQKDIQLRLLPDLQKQLEQKQTEEFQTRALEKQNEVLKLENEKLKLTVEQLAKPEPKKGFLGWFLGAK